MVVDGFRSFLALVFTEVIVAAIQNTFRLKAAADELLKKQKNYEQQSGNHT